jgi:predicted PurR-regulated permease PerM
MPSWLGTTQQRYRAFLIAMLSIVLLAVMRKAHAALVPFFLGFILAYLLVPLVDFFDRHSPRFLKKWKLSRRLAIILVYLLALGGITGMLAYFIPALTAQSQEFARELPNYVQVIDKLLTVDMKELLERIPDGISDAVETTVQNAVVTLGETLRRGVEGTVRTLWQTLGFIIGVLIIPIWLFYVLNDTDRLRRAVKRMIPEKMDADVRNIVAIVDGLLSAYVRGQLLICLLVGLMVTILLLAFRINMALLLGTLAGFFEVIPFLGPWIGAIPAVLIAFLRSPITALWVALGFFAIQQIESNLLSPRITGRAVRFHPAIVMVVVVVGSEVAGLLGVLLAVPVSAVARDVYQYLYLRTTERGATPEMAMETLNARNL